MSFVVQLSGIFPQKQVMNHQAGNCNKQTWIQVYLIFPSTHVSSRNNISIDIDMGNNQKHIFFVKQDRLENIFPTINHILPIPFRLLLSIIF